MRKKLIILLALAASGVIAFFLVYTYVYNKPHPDYATTPADAAMSAQELYEAFTLDHDHAQSAYLGKMIEVSGVVDAIEYVGEQPIAVFYFDEGPFGSQGVRGTFLSMEASNAMHVDDFITLKGYCTGFTGEDVILEHCTLVQ